MYSIKQLLKQEPATLVTVINLWLAFLVVVGAISASGETIAQFGAAMNATLLLFYVRTLVSSNDALQQLGDKLALPDEGPIPPEEWGMPGD